jgi:hypothetical protein
MPGREGSRCLTRQEQVASYSRALVMTAATATTLRAAVLLRCMSRSRSRVFPGVCMKAHEGVFQGAPRGGAHTSPPNASKHAVRGVGPGLSVTTQFKLNQVNSHWFGFSFLSLASC